MNGLINDLNDVSIGDESGPQFRDERSRSSWAQVVSGEEQEGEVPTQPPPAHTQNHWTRQDQRQQHQNQCDESYRRPHKAVQEGHGQNDYDQTQQNQKENDNDGWETVGKKAPRKPHKVVKDQWHVYKQPSSEQHYSDQVEIGSDIEPSRKELGDLSEACNKLWELDFNRLVPGRDYQIDCGEGKKVYQRQDMAEGSLFEWLGEDVLNRPTIARFCSLLDNYNPNEGCREVVTSEERQEQAAFIEEISRTAPIQYLHKYLSAKGIVSENCQEFKRMLTGLWFDLYGRGDTSGSSSAFEHVFVGEIKQRNEDSVSGFHNWLQFYLEEAKGRVDYQGYIFPRRRGEIPDSETQLLTIQFEWNGVLKSVSSTMVGVSPEFEIALYTLCYYMGGEDNRVQVGPYPVNIKCYRHGQRIGSVFPIAES